MGYANGKDCCRAGCAVHSTIEDKIGCCAAICPSFSDECVDTCIRGNPSSEVYAALSRAGRVIRGTEHAAVDRKDRAQRFLSVMAALPTREHDRFRLAAQSILNDLAR